jgi:hypothetical protein
MPPKLRSFPIDNSKYGVRFVQNRDLITRFIIGTLELFGR